MDLPVSADFVIIGGGCIGSSLAHRLASKGVGSVLLLEKDTIASGSTGRAAGLVSQQWEDEFHLRLSKESVRFFRDLHEEGRFGPLYHQVGYTHLLFDQGELEAARQALTIQHAMGIPTVVLSPEEIEALLPGINLEGVVGATDCSEDGYTDPHLVTNAIAELARAAGAVVRTGCEATGVEVRKGRVLSVQTTEGTVATGMVIDCAGPWAANVSRLAGIDIPVRPFKRQLWFTDRVEALADDAPVVMDRDHDFYFRRELDGVVLCYGQPDQPSTFNTDVDWSWADSVAEYAMHRYAPFGEARLVSAWAAPRDITPDHEAIIGPLPGLEGFLVAAGHSGHGFMLSPAVGGMLADYLVSGKAALDFSHLGIERFHDVDWQESVYAGDGLLK